MLIKIVAVLFVLSPHFISAVNDPELAECRECLRECKPNAVRLCAPAKDNQLSNTYEWNSLGDACQSELTVIDSINYHCLTFSFDDDKRCGAETTKDPDTGIISVKNLAVIQGDNLGMIKGKAYNYDISCYYEGEFTKVLVVNTGSETSIDVTGDPVDDLKDVTIQGCSFEDTENPQGGCIGDDAKEPIIIGGAGEYDPFKSQWWLDGCSYLQLPPVSKEMNEFSVIVDFQISRVATTADTVKVLTLKRADGTEEAIIEAQKFPSNLCPSDAAENDICCTSAVICSSWSRLVLVQNENIQNIYNKGDLVSTITKSLLLSIGDAFILSPGKDIDTCDTIPPIPTTIYPIHSSTGVNTQTLLTILLDEEAIENIQKNIILSINGVETHKIALTNIDEYSKLHVIQLPKLRPMTTYEVTIEEGSFKDKFDNESTVFENPWSFTTGLDADKDHGYEKFEDYMLEVIGVVPSPGGNLPNKTSLALVFSQIMNVNEDSLIDIAVDGTSLASSQYTVEAHGETLVITPIGEWGASGSLTLEIPIDAVSGIVNSLDRNQTFTFTLTTSPSDSVPPQLAVPPSDTDKESMYPSGSEPSTIPESGNSPLIINFDGPIKAGTGNILVGTPPDQTTIDVQDTSKILIVGSTLIILPMDSLDLQSLDINICDTCIESSTSNIPIGSPLNSTTNPKIEIFGDEEIYKFELENNGIIPPSGSENVSTKSPICFVYTNTIESVNDSPKPEVTSESEGQFDDFAVSINGNAVCLVPSTEWPANTLLNVVIPANSVVDESNGSNGKAIFYDVSTVPLPAEAELEFSTNNPPSYTPSKNGGFIDPTKGVEIVATFNQNLIIKPGFDVTVTNGAGETFTFPTSDTDQISVENGVVTIKTSNLMGESDSWTVIIPAGALATSPGDKATLSDTVIQIGKIENRPTESVIPDIKKPGPDMILLPDLIQSEIPPESSIVLVFDELAIDVDVSKIAVVQAGSVPFTNFKVEVVGPNVILTPLDAWPASTAATLSIPADTIKDAAGLVNDRIDIPFTTMDTTPNLDTIVPTLSVIDPPSINPKIISSPGTIEKTSPYTTMTIVFNVPIKISADGKITLIGTAPDGSTISQEIDLNDSTQVKVSGTALVITPKTFSLSPNYIYSIDVPAGAVITESSVPSGQIILESFGIEDDTDAPEIVMVIPSGDGTDPRLSELFVIFNEEITTEDVAGQVIIINANDPDDLESGFTIPPTLFKTMVTGLLIPLPSSLKNNFSYKATMNFDAVKDTSGNSFEGNYEWYFSTGGSSKDGEIDTIVDKIYIIDEAIEDGNAKDLGSDLGKLIDSGRTFNIDMSACSTPDCDETDDSPFKVSDGDDFFYLTASVIEGPGMWLYFEKCNVSPKDKTDTTALNVQVLGNGEAYCADGNLIFEQYSERDRVRARIESFRFADENYIYITCTLSMCFDRFCKKPICDSTGESPSTDYLSDEARLRRLDADASVVPPSGFIDRRIPRALSKSKIIYHESNE
eukprot:GHVL01026724.1.p1 GENE.GHVL01026724.1~~GHVL01026724.1.p1  ORF type:complete len:1498 (+),score=337.37 GHVL01026724.1:126-4619(+)